MQCAEQWLWVRSIWICTKIAAKRKLEAGHRLYVRQHVIFWAHPRRINGELMITAWAEAGVATHRFHETLFVLGRDIHGIVNNI